ncbi:MAG: response regulator [Candidatus Gastranaerophilales bacterium]|nr:response regulator [Candidatus Gastranaerophilales bacterium]
MSANKKRILIVDDEQDIVETLKFMLESEGFECLSAYDGEEALNLAKNEKPDLIILDVMLPKINGYKICRLLKFDAKYKNIPILMITARSQEEDKAIGEETGADEYITKPFEISDVAERAKLWIEKSCKV